MKRDEGANQTVPKKINFVLLDAWGYHWIESNYFAYLFSFATFKWVSECNGRERVAYIRILKIQFDSNGFFFSSLIPAFSIKNVSLLSIA